MRSFPLKGVLMKGNKSIWATGLLACGAVIAVVAPAVGAQNGHAAHPTSMRRINSVPPTAHSPAFVASATSVGGHVMSLWIARSPAGGECQYLQDDGLSPATVMVNAAANDPCTVGPQSVPLSIHIGWARNSDGTYAVGFNGTAASDSGITSVVFHSTSSIGTGSFASKGVDYVGSLPNVASSGMLPPGDYSVDGVASTGQVVAHIDFAQFLSHSLAPR